MPRAPKDPVYEAILERWNRDLAAGAADDAQATFTAPLVIVGGLLRSGTTLVYQLLAASGSFVYPSNVVARCYRRPVAGWRIERLLEPYFRPPTWRFESEAGRTGAWHEPSEIGYFWHHHLPLGEHHEPSPETLDRLDTDPMVCALAALQSADGRPLVVKNPILGYLYGWLLDRIPEARMVWIARAPLAVAASILRMRRAETGSVDRWWSTRPARATELESSPPEEQVAAQVRSLLDAGAAARARHANRWLDVEYDTVCRDPRAEIVKISAFAGAALPRPFAVPALRRAEPAVDAATLDRLSGALREAGVSPERVG